MYLFRSGEEALLFCCSEGMHLSLSVWKNFFRFSVGEGTSSTSNLIRHIDKHK